MSAFLCPSDPNNGGNNTVLINGQNKLVCTTDYYWNVGKSRFFNGGMVNGPSYSPGRPDDSISPAAHAPTRSITLASFTDGTSNTVVMSESVQSNSGQEVDGLGDGLRRSRPGTSSSARVAQHRLPTGWPPSIARTHRDCAHDYWWKGEFALSGGHNIYSHTQTPNRRSCYCTGVNSYPADVERPGLRRRHPDDGRRQLLSPRRRECLFMDGSVHFIKNSVNFQTWYALATPAGGEVVSSDSY